MSTHMRELINRGYVAFSKSLKSNKPLTRYWMTEKGKSEFTEYIENLR